jgi:hypothetical protein
LRLSGSGAAHRQLASPTLRPNRLPVGRRGPTHRPRGSYRKCALQEHAAGFLLRGRCQLESCCLFSRSCRQATTLPFGSAADRTETANRSSSLSVDRLSLSLLAAQLSGPRERRKIQTIPWVPGQLTSSSENNPVREPISTTSTRTHRPCFNIG